MRSCWMGLVAITLARSSPDQAAGPGSFGRTPWWGKGLSGVLVEVDARDRVMPIPLRRAAARARTIVFMLAGFLLGACQPRTVVTEGNVPLAGGASVEYRVAGSGPDTVVVIHGGPALDLTYLLQSLMPLSRSRTLIFYDQRGRGRSQSPTDGTMPTLASDLADLDALRQHFHLGRATLIGHHYGALLAALYAERTPNVVRRLVLLSPLHPRQNYVYDLSRIPIDSASQAAFWAALATGNDTTNPLAFCREFWGFQFTPAVLTDARVVARLADVICTDSTWTFRRRENVTRALYSSFGDLWDWRPTLGRIPVPTLVIQGSTPHALESADARRDAILRHGAETWAASMPSARFMTLSGPALFPWLGHERALFRSVGAFLDGGWPDDARRVSMPPTPS